MKPLAKGRPVDGAHAGDAWSVCSGIDTGVFLGALFLWPCHMSSIAKTSLSQKRGRWLLETERLKK